MIELEPMGSGIVIALVMLCIGIFIGAVLMALGFWFGFKASYAIRRAAIDDVAPTKNPGEFDLLDKEKVEDDKDD